MNPSNPVSEIMTTDLITVNPEDTLNTVYKLFEEKNIHHVPVVEAGSEVVGIISKEDIFKIAYILSKTSSGNTFDGDQYSFLRARDIMTRRPLMLDPDDTIGLAADIFKANHFHALPIVEEGKLVGIVTTHDLLQYSYNSNVVLKKDDDGMKL